MPTACSGLLDERGKTGAVTSPATATAPPAASRTITEPRWYPSTKPERTTSASNSPPAYVSATWLEAQQFAGLVGGGGRALRQGGGADRTGDQLHGGLHRLNLGGRDCGLHAEPQGAAG